MLCLVFVDRAILLCRRLVKDSRQSLDAGRDGQSTRPETSTKLAENSPPCRESLRAYASPQAAIRMELAGAASARARRPSWALKVERGLRLPRECVVVREVLWIDFPLANEWQLKREAGTARPVQGARSRRVPGEHLRVEEGAVRAAACCATRDRPAPVERRRAEDVFRVLARSRTRATLDAEAVDLPPTARAVHKLRGDGLRRPPARARAGSRDERLRARRHGDGDPCRMVEHPDGSIGACLSRSTWSPRRLPTSIRAGVRDVGRAGRLPEPRCVLPLQLHPKSPSKPIDTKCSRARRGAHGLLGPLSGTGGSEGPAG